MDNNKDKDNKSERIKQLALKILQDKQKNKAAEVSSVATPPTPAERAEALHRKVRSAYMKKLLPSLEKN